MDSISLKHKYSKEFIETTSGNLLYLLTKSPITSKEAENNFRHFDIFANHGCANS